jgi:hypothetical protein
MKMTLNASLLPYPTIGDAQVRTSDNSLHYCKADGVWTSITGGAGITQGAALPPAPVVNDLYLLTTDDTLYYCKTAGIWTSTAGGGTTPGGGAGAIQYNDGLGGFGGDETKLLWTNSPDRLTISKWDGGFPMPAPIIDSNCILSLSTTGNATNFWFAVPAGGTNASFGFSTGGLGFKHAMTYMIGENKLALTSFGAWGSPPDGLYVDASNNVSIGYILAIPAKLYVGGTFWVTGEARHGAAVDYKVEFLGVNTTLDATHHIVVCRNALTVKLPPVLSCVGREYIIKILVAFGPVTVETDNMGELIDGAWQYLVSPPYGSVTIVSDGTEWIITATV